MRLLEFPVVPLIDIPGRLRLLAEQIEDGEFGEVQNVLCAVENEDEVRPVYFGACSDPFRIGGLFHFAAGIVMEPGE